MNFSIAIDKVGINQALFQVTHGLYILTAFSEKPNGQCLDALMQVTNNPPRIAIGVGKHSLTHEMISKTGLFVANVLDLSDPACFDKIKLFGFNSGKTIDKFASIQFEKTENNIPILSDAKAFYECKIISELTLDLGTHSLFVADINRAGLKSVGEPITYNEYRKILKKERVEK